MRWWTGSCREAFAAIPVVARQVGTSGSTVVELASAVALRRAGYMCRDGVLVVWWRDRRRDRCRVVAHTGSWDADPREAWRALFPERYQRLQELRAVRLCRDLGVGYVEGSIIVDDSWRQQRVLVLADGHHYYLTMPSGTYRMDGRSTGSSLWAIYDVFGVLLTSRPASWDELCEWLAVCAVAR